MYNGLRYSFSNQSILDDTGEADIDYINGAVATLSKQRHIEAPFNRFITELIHTTES
ncbi:2-dehydropantoate 2-reductase, partial [Staphylococcus aureus]